MKKHFLFLLKVSIFLSYLGAMHVQGMLLDLFGDKDRHGISIRIEVDDSDCSNLPISWSSKTSSVNTLGSCVQFYDEPFCKGSLTIIQPFHTIHQMDLSLINFAKRIQSASACGPKIKTGRYVIQNAADASILTVNSKFGGFARAFTSNATTLITKAQQWDVIELSNSEYSLKPREFEDNYPVSYDEDGLKQGKIKKKLWKLMSVGRGRYLIKNEPLQRCLYKTEEMKVEEHDCRIWSPNQEWVLKEIFGNAKTPKKSSAVGPGLNYNILSKVAGYVPPSKPPPQFEPIFYNASALAQLKRRSTAAPYVVRKKIKRGPRPISRPVPLLLTHIRPPGLHDRPALSAKVANNNKYLLLKNKQNSLNLKEFEPTDDRIETYAYYQQVLLAHMKKEDLMKELIKRQKQQQQKVPPFPPPNKETDKVKEENSEEDDDDEENEEQPKEAKRKPEKESEEVQDEQEEAEEQSQEDNSDEEDEKRKRPYNPYNDIHYNHNHNHNHTQSQEDTAPTPPPDDEIPGSHFITSMFSKVKSGLGSFVPSINFINVSKNTTTSSAEHAAQASHTHNHPHSHHPPPNYDYGPPPPPSRDEKPHKKRRPNNERLPYPHLLRPHLPNMERQEEIKHGLRLPKRPSTSTTTTSTTAKPRLWSFLG